MIRPLNLSFKGLSAERCEEMWKFLKLDQII
jgi:hypothetical protein